MHLPCRLVGGSGDDSHDTRWRQQQPSATLRPLQTGSSKICISRTTKICAWHLHGGIKVYFITKLYHPNYYDSFNSIDRLSSDVKPTSIMPLPVKCVRGHTFSTNCKHVWHFSPRIQASPAAELSLDWRGCSGCWRNGHTWQNVFGIF